MLSTTLASMAKRKAVQRALIHYAAIRDDLRTFDGDNRGIAAALEHAENDVVQEVVNAYEAWRRKNASEKSR